MKQTGEVYQPKSEKGNARKWEICTCHGCWARANGCPSPRGRCLERSRPVARPPSGPTGE
ncbi:hypothetical protein EFR84_12380 [Rhizobium chutanense]|uniref:Uncharacterized protein n=1 Tax=Rhizobium chutanense TaxID=2035448 RepID=A0A3S0S245_9HYPH|nr:hypothetical protein EFR84_12380 [Rhizobium chutanense]